MGSEPPQDPGRFNRLNHSSTHITREIYTHVTPPMRSGAADLVAEQIFGRPGK